MKSQEFNTETKLRFVRIYFDTTTFEKVTKDRAAKFEDMLSAIGGTMGLLTGFSIISAVEVVYFSLKIFIRLFKRKEWTNPERNEHECSLPLLNKYMFHVYKKWFSISLYMPVDCWDHLARSDLWAWISVRDLFKCCSVSVYQYEVYFLFSMLCRL